LRNVGGLTNIYRMSHFNVIRVNDNLCRFSHNGDKFAYYVENKLTAVNTLTVDECQTYSCVSAIEVSYHCFIYEEITVSLNFRSGLCSKERKV
jgi:hypothetical protein